MLTDFTVVQSLRLVKFAPIGGEGSKSMSLNAGIIQIKFDRIISERIQLPSLPEQRDAMVAGDEHRFMRILS
jgi:hypothetical protein